MATKIKTYYAISSDGLKSFPLLRNFEIPKSADPESLEFCEDDPTSAFCLLNGANFTTDNYWIFEFRQNKSQGGLEPTYNNVIDVGTPNPANKFYEDCKLEWDQQDVQSRHLDVFCRGIFKLLKITGPSGVWNSAMLADAGTKQYIRDWIDPSSLYVAAFSIETLAKRIISSYALKDKEPSANLAKTFNLDAKDLMILNVPGSGFTEMLNYYLKPTNQSVISLPDAGLLFTELPLITTMLNLDSGSNTGSKKVITWGRRWCLPHALPISDQHMINAYRQKIVALADPFYGFDSTQIVSFMNNRNWDYSAKKYTTDNAIKNWISTSKTPNDATITTQEHVSAWLTFLVLMPRVIDYKKYTPAAMKLNDVITLDENPVQTTNFGKLSGFLGQIDTLISNLDSFQTHKNFLMFWRCHIDLIQVLRRTVKHTTGFPAWWAITQANSETEVADILKYVKTVWPFITLFSRSR